MACRPYRWPPERRAEVERAIRESRTRAEAGARIGTTARGIDGAAATYGFTMRTMLGTLYAQAGDEIANAHKKVDQAPEVVKVPVCPKNAESFGQPLIDWTGARPASTGVGLERRLLLGDTHIPFHDLRACAAVLALARAIQPHVIIQLGDYWNMGAVSHHAPPPGGAENHARAMLQGRAYLEALHRAVPGAELVLMLGNHDAWLEEYVLDHRTLAGSLEPSIPEYVRVIPRRAQPYVRGPVAYTHGYGGGEMAAKKYAIEVAPAMGVKHVRAGHHHTLQCHHARNGAEAWIVGWLGRASEPAFDYAKNRDHWRLAVCVDDVIGDRVTTTPVRLDGGAALYGGRLIAA